LVWLALVLVRFPFTAVIERTHTECEDDFYSTTQPKVIISRTNAAT
jgi:hypothetical protein